MELIILRSFDVTILHLQNLIWRLIVSKLVPRPGMTCFQVQIVLLSDKILNYFQGLQSNQISLL